ncbi:hypothetical protein [Oceanobacillus halotolerans]|uniref:hypothetical protein n=1 Tax=Oceanobacillus halotolerans TaxID=2663380 RepID=UPI001CF7D388|nr:hypothetical protein [Oceanobacillus halotolerans]
MKRTFSIIICSLIFLILNNGNSIAVEETEDQVLIESYYEDITGDGQKDEIRLMGVPFSEETSYFHSIWVDISTPNDREWKISYEGGYDPSLQFIDVNHDNINDIIYQSATGGTGELYHYNVHTLANDKVSVIELPKPAYISGKFQEDFKASLTITPGKDPIIVDLKDRADDYIRLGLYNTEGELQEQKTLMVDPIAFFDPVFINKEKGYGLKSYQQISGAYHADQLGTIETLWYLEKDKWRNVKTEWVPSDIE